MASYQKKPPLGEVWWGLLSTTAPFADGQNKASSCSTPASAFVSIRRSATHAKAGRHSPTPSYKPSRSTAHTSSSSSGEAQPARRRSSSTPPSTSSWRAYTHPLSPPTVADGSATTTSRSATTGSSSKAWNPSDGSLRRCRTPPGR